MEQKNLSHFDYIIAGAGCAGLSLLIHWQDAGLTAGKKILLLDKAPKTGNDRTWCFWETKPGKFEELVHHCWPRVSFFSRHWSAPLHIAPYQYKMIRSADFYGYCMERIRKDPAVTVLYAEITAVENESGGIVRVEAGGNLYSGNTVFSSLLLKEPGISEKEHYLLQHFKGWVIETEKAVFDPGKATLMDFRVSQEAGTTFVYVLPLSERKALVEYTLFTEDVLLPEQYDAALKNYLATFLSIDTYNILEEEFGIIPMTNYQFPTHEGNIVYIGTAGGQTKASSGYTFRYIQKHSAAVTQALLTGKSPHEAGKTPARFAFYDSVLLRILRHRILEGADIFTDLFRKGNAATVFRFLDNETTFPQDLDIMRRLPVGPFSKAALAQIFR